MIHWRDEALILQFARHGESAALLDILTKNHGRYRGIVRGGGSRKQAPFLQAGGLVSVEFSARLEEHLGSFRVEPIRNYSVQIMGDASKLAGFQSLAALSKFSMEERDPHPALYQATLSWLEDEDIAQAYLNWELVLLKEAGFELELRACAVTGSDEDLAYISPKTGRAVSRGAAGEWADKLLPYSPAFRGVSSRKDVLQALEVTEYFLINWLAQMIGKARLPKARERFIRALSKEG